ncbi:MAG: hypothetical protein ACOC8L_08360, partial [Spirochaetota bacterium]
LSLPAGTTSHDIPANTLSADTGYDVTVQATNQKIISSDALGAGSGIAAASVASDSFTTQ